MAPSFNSSSWVLPARNFILGFVRVPPYWLDSLPLTSICYRTPWWSFTRQYSLVSELVTEPVHGVPPVVRVPGLPGSTSNIPERPYMGRSPLECSVELLLIGPYPGALLLDRPTMTDSLLLPRAGVVAPCSSRSGDSTGTNFEATGDSVRPDFWEFSDVS